MPEPPKKRARMASPADDNDAIDPHATNNQGAEGDEETSDAGFTLFELPGVTPDVRLLVFDQEYHVHSIILKLRSNYFRKFLDSPDKSGTPASADFHYEYATALDDDGAWALEPADKVKEPVFTPERLALLEEGGTLSPKLEDTTFWKLLCAMYNCAYSIDEISDVINLTRVADFYCALPVVSATLSGQLWESSLFNETDNEHAASSDPISLLFAARKLRHRHLFRECIVHIVSQLAHIESQNGALLEQLQQDEDIYNLAQKHYRLLCQKIMKATVEQIKFMQDPKQTYWMPSQAARKCISSTPEENASYYFEINSQLIKENHGDCAAEFKSAVRALLKNDLLLGRTGDKPGRGAFRRKFLCCDVKDVELPWDQDEVDW